MNDEEWIIKMKNLMIVFLILNFNLDQKIYIMYMNV